MPLVSEVYGGMSDLDDLVGHYQYRRPVADCVDRCQYCGRNDRPGELCPSLDGQTGAVMDAHFICAACYEAIMQDVERENEFWEAEPWEPRH